MERLASLAAHPAGAALSIARLRFSRALRRHLRHVDGTILAHLRATDAASVKPAIEAYRRLLHDYHEAAAHHVARWPSTSVTADRDGYRRSVDDMLARLRKRIQIEQRGAERASPNHPFQRLRPSRRCHDPDTLNIDPAQRKIVGRSQTR